MKRISLIMLVMLLACLGLVGCSDTSTNNRIPPPDGYDSWAEYQESNSSDNANTATATSSVITTPYKATELGDWSGYADLMTESFTATNSRWAIAWSQGSDPNYNKGTHRLRVYVYDINSPAEPILLAINNIGGGSGLFDMNGTGTYFLKIYSDYSVYAISAIQ